MLLFSSIKRVDHTFIIPTRNDINVSDPCLKKYVHLHGYAKQNKNLGKKLYPEKPYGNFKLKWKRHLHFIFRPPNFDLQTNQAFIIFYSIRNLRIFHAPAFIS